MRVAGCEIHGNFGRLISASMLSMNRARSADSPVCPALRDRRLPSLRGAERSGARVLCSPMPTRQSATQQVGQPALRFMAPIHVQSWRCSLSMNRGSTTRFEVCRHQQEPNPKSEARDPKETRNPRPEERRPTLRRLPTPRCHETLERRPPSDFGLRASFGFRISALGFSRHALPETSSWPSQFAGVGFRA